MWYHHKRRFEPLCKCLSESSYFVAGCLDGSRIHGSEREASCITLHKTEKTVDSLLKDLRFVNITNMTLKVSPCHWDLGWISGSVFAGCLPTASPHRTECRTERGELKVSFVCRPKYTLCFVLTLLHYEGRSLKGGSDPLNGQQHQHTSSCSSKEENSELSQVILTAV